MVDVTLKILCNEVSAFRYRMGLTRYGPIAQMTKVIEEIGETLFALVENDDVEALDGFCDILYALLGAVDAAGITPERFEAALLEVCRSNGTKTADGTMSPRGPDYSPPNLENV